MKKSKRKNMELDKNKFLKTKLNIDNSIKSESKELPPLDKSSKTPSDKRKLIEVKSLSSSKRKRIKVEGIVDKIKTIKENKFIDEAEFIDPNIKKPSNSSATVKEVFLCSECRREFCTSQGLEIHRMLNHGYENSIAKEIFIEEEVDNDNKMNGHIEHEYIGHKTVKGDAVIDKDPNLGNISVNDSIDSLKKAISESLAAVRTLNPRQQLINDCPYFKEHPKSVSLFVKGDEELQDGKKENLPRGWHFVTKTFQSGQKRFFISPDRVFCFHSRGAVLEFLKFDMKCSDKELYDFEMPRGKRLHA